MTHPVSPFSLLKRRLWTLVLLGVFCGSIFIFVRAFQDDSVNIFAVVPPLSQSSGAIESYYKDLSEKYGNFDSIVLITPNSHFDTNAYFESFPTSGKYCYQAGQELDCIQGEAFESSFYTGVTYGKLFEKKEEVYSVTEASLGKQFQYLAKFFPQTQHIYSLILRPEMQESIDYKKMRKAFFDLAIPGKKVLYIASTRGARSAPENLLRFQNQRTFEVLSTKNEMLQAECPNCLLLLGDIARSYKKEYFSVREEVYTPGKTPLETTSYFLGEFIKTPKKPQEAAIYGVWFGDTHFTRAFTYSNAKSQEEYLQCFLQNADISKNPKYSTELPLKGFDIVGSSLKSSVVSKKECPNKPETSRFNTDPTQLEMFADIGFTTFSLANNHTYSCGYEGYRATQANLKNLGFDFFGEEKRDKSIVLQKEIRGIRVAFIGINDIQATWDKKEIKQKIEALKQEGNLVIVAMNWGAEYQKEANERQRDIGHFLVDAGASLILGSHPHIVQGVEIYKETPIVYSLGNFMFDQPFENTLKGQGIVFALSASGKVEYQMLDFVRNPKTYQIDCSTFK